MKLEVKRHGLNIVPEGPIDEAYIEEVLKLKESGDSIKLVRYNAHALSSTSNTSSIAYLKTERELEEYEL